jgi:O-antigen/teichoic acid export membrane protein
VLAIGAVFDSAKNIGIALARKDLNFSLDFRFHVYVRLVNFVVTIGLALMLRSYWALIFGRVLSSAISVPLSFAMYSYRPRLSLAKAGKYLRFSLSIVPLKIGRYLNGRFGAIVVGGFGGAGQLGVYNVGAELSAMLTQEILVPLGRGLMPNYSKLNHDPVMLAEAYSHVLRIAAAFILPMGFGLSAVATDFVELVLGSQWRDAGVIVQLLALYSMLAGLIHIMSNQILITSGHERRSALLIWIRLAILVPALIVGGRLAGVSGVAAASLASAVIAFPIVVFVLVRSIPVTLGTVIGAFWRPVVAAIVMATYLQWVSQELVMATSARLLIEIASGALVYLVTLVGLWWISGRPRGVEQLAIGMLAARAGKSAS